MDHQFKQACPLGAHDDTHACTCSLSLLSCCCWGTSAGNKRRRSPSPDSCESRIRLCYQVNSQSSRDFTTLRTGPAGASDYFCDISYDGGVQIWHTIGDRVFTVKYVADQLVFEALLKRVFTGQWVEWDKSWTPADSDAQLVLRV